MTKMTYYEIEEIKALKLIAKRLDEISKEMKKINETIKPVGQAEENDSGENKMTYTEETNDPD